MDFDYSEVDRILTGSLPTKDFEIKVKYAPEIGWGLVFGYIYQGTIGAGTILIGDKTYTTKPVNFSGSFANFYLHCYKLSYKNDLVVTWNVSVQTSARPLTFHKGVKVLARYINPLVFIENGMIVADYRYLICLSSKSIERPGQVSFNVINEKTGEESRNYVCLCPPVYDGYTMQIQELEWLKETTEEHLKQLKGN